MYRRNSKRLLNDVLHLSCHAFEKQEKNYQFLAGRQTSNFTCSIFNCDNILNQMKNEKKTFFSFSIQIKMFQLILEWVTHLYFRLLARLSTTMTICLHLHNDNNISSCFVRQQQRCIQFRDIPRAFCIELLCANCLHMLTNNKIPNIDPGENGFLSDSAWFPSCCCSSM